jgi:aldehyde:ferredoxin oxidoreductase
MQGGFSDSPMGVERCTILGHRLRVLRAYSTTDRNHCTSRLAAGLSSTYSHSRGERMQAHGRENWVKMRPYPRYPRAIGKGRAVLTRGTNPCFAEMRQVNRCPCGVTDAGRAAGVHSSPMGWFT